MLISEAINHDNYHKLDVLATRYEIIYSSLIALMDDLFESRQDFIKNNKYADFIQLLNVVDAQIYEFMKLAIDIAKLAKYFDNYKRNYISGSDIHKAVKNVRDLRAKLK